MEERIQKFLARAGVASRRRAEELVAEGEVRVNGKVIDEPGFRIDPEKDVVKIGSRRIQAENPVYLIMNKPRGTICTAEDPEQRVCVTDLVKGIKARVYTVGRLDYDTSGVLILTNDGELSNKLTHPRHGVTKTYHAKVKGIPQPKVLERLAGGVYIEGGRTAPAQVKLLAVKEKNAVIEIILTEGRNRQVRNMCAAVGHSVIRLERVVFGGLTAVGLKPGQWRRLLAEELEILKAEIRRKKNTAVMKAPEKKSFRRDNRP